MSFLFQVSGLRVQPSTEVLLVEPFKTIWDRDTTPKKATAIKEFTYIEFMSSMKSSNPYSGYVEEDRHNKLSEELFGIKNYKPSKEVEEGIIYLKSLQKEGSPTYTYYIAATTAADKLRKFLMSFNINERNQKGIPLYKPADITKAINDTEKILSNLSSMKEKMQKELMQMTRTRAAKVINHFER